MQEHLPSSGTVKPAASIVTVLLSFWKLEGDKDATAVWSPYTSSRLKDYLKTFSSGRRVHLRPVFLHFLYVHSITSSLGESNSHLCRISMSFQCPPPRCEFFMLFYYIIFFQSFSLVLPKMLPSSRSILSSVSK